MASNVQERVLWFNSFCFTHSYDDHPPGMWMPVMLPGQDLDLGGQVTVATAPDEKCRSHTTLLATTVLVGGPSGFPYGMSNSGLHGQPLSEVL